MLHGLFKLTSYSLNAFVEGMTPRQRDLTVYDVTTSPIVWKLTPNEKQNRGQQEESDDQQGRAHEQHGKIRLRLETKRNEFHCYAMPDQYLSCAHVNA